MLQAQAADRFLCNSAALNDLELGLVILGVGPERARAHIHYGLNLLAERLGGRRIDLQDASGAIDGTFASGVEPDGNQTSDG